MGAPDYFVILAEMRTGSNFLEESLDAAPGLKCWGEAFNPHFVGAAGRREMAGIDIAARNADPLRLLAAIRERTDGVAGFRLFHDHDPRILEHCLADPRCAKVILRRNPLDSFVSLQIARRTGQWRLGAKGTARMAKIRFEPADFAAYLDMQAAAAAAVTRRLQISGQSAFHIDYDALGDVEILNGLCRFLGARGPITAASSRTRVQNPAPVSQKVENPEEMAAALAELSAQEPFGAGRSRSLEPDRGARVPTYLVAASCPLLFVPLPGGPRARIRGWMEALSPGGAPPLQGMTQKSLRRWRRTNPGHRSFAVLRHPAARAHAVFVERILYPGPHCDMDLRESLRSHHGVPLPEGPPEPNFGLDAHRAAFLAFLAVLRGSLQGQTGLRVPPEWATQSALLQGTAQVLLPDRLLREDMLAQELDAMARPFGRQASVPPARTGAEATLSRIHDPALEEAVRSAYQRDYMMFGFEDWRPEAAG
ncbi:nodulation protein NodH [Profundibacterium mesophilum]|uniref:Nodulation protein NodH n=1 Tax=Profundibacterium mesophilum KAUST100406-0324 TaxID=1037889 RepID=A0A921NTL7_9RHOB|nr:nodulation protein NodH [Profundibacterium mesophilum]KAF0676384.1 hypothetical protein PMES_01115 [Profundibacterium mesophilum KAUST100406-0324]